VLGLLAITLLVGAGRGLAANNSWPGLGSPAISLSGSEAAPASNLAAHATHPIAPLSFSSDWLQANPAPALAAHARSGILIDLDSNRVLWQREPDAERAPASLTKMVTAMVALDLRSLSSQVTVSTAAAQMPPDVMGLSAGEVVSVRDLMYGVFLDSGNDAAEALADGIVPHTTFISLMNKKVRAMGLTRTHFTDPTGLDAPGHYSSAHDLAVIAATLMSAYPELLPIIATEQIMLPATATHKAFNASNLNKLLRDYSGAIGMKTGFTDNAGGCLVAVAVRGGRHLMAVVLDSDIFFTEAAQLLDYGFSTPT